LSISITRDHVLQADIGNVAIVHDGPDARRQTHADRLHVVRFEGPLAADVVDRVERRLNRGANRPLLDVGVDHLETLAEAIDQHVRVCLRCVHLKEVVITR
jgi:hypothetical protein